MTTRGVIFIRNVLKSFSAIAFTTVVCIHAGGCATNSSPPIYERSPELSAESTSEAELLDVGIELFSVGNTNELDPARLQIRNAESVFIPVQIRDALSNQGIWGVVSLLPVAHSQTDILITGEIQKTGGESFGILVNAADSTGAVWIIKAYKMDIDPATCMVGSETTSKVFENLYQEIANDIAVVLQARGAKERKNIRSVSMVRFARDFAPDVYSNYLIADPKGHFAIADKIPSEYAFGKRIEKIRARDQMFVDLLNEEYSAFAEEFSIPYVQWTLEECMAISAMRQAKSRTARKIFGGVANVFAGLNPLTMFQVLLNPSAAKGIGFGSTEILEGVGSRQDVKMHAETLVELSESLSAKIGPTVLELEDRTIRLIGNVGEQYAQWRETLRQMYLTDEIVEMPVAR